MNLYFRKEWVTPAVGVASFAAGVGVGYLVCLKRIDRQIEADLQELRNNFMDMELVQEEVDRADVEAYEETKDALIKGIVSFKEDAVPNDQYAVEREIEVDDDQDSVVIVEDFAQAVKDELEVKEPETNNIFEDNWDVAEEIANRTEDAPYILHVNEFFENDKGYRQTTLTWYDGDKILCDEDNTPIYAPQKVVGKLEFGRGSNDPNMVYIRNDKLKAEYEISRDPGHYQIEVLGLEMEAQAEADDLKHSNAVPKFKLRE